MTFLREGPMYTRVRALRGLALALAMGGAALLLALPTAAQVPGTVPATPGAAAVQPTTPAAAVQHGARGEHEGIKVHGHWVIEVRNPDGTVTARREFENSLQATGGNLLSALLVGGDVPGSWTVLLNHAGSPPTGNSGVPGPCVSWNFRMDSVGLSAPGNGQGGTCILTFPPDSSGDGSFWTAACEQAVRSPSPCSLNLTFSAPPGNSTITLSGTVPVTATSAGTINDVETALSVCSTDAPAATPSTCKAMLDSAGNYAGTLTYATRPQAPQVFTQALLGQTGGPARVPYNPGQTIAVTVTLSFQ
jgi:hypothetical protein